MKRAAIAFFSLWLCLWAIQSAWALSGKHIVALKNAGVSDQTIGVVVREKVIETAAFSVEDIIAMKKAGVGEQTLQLIIKDGSFLRDNEPVVYGQSTQSVRHISPADIVYLKNNGVSDEVIQSVIEASKSDNQQDRERAWRMLENMRLWHIERSRH